MGVQGLWGGKGGKRIGCIQLLHLNPCSVLRCAIHLFLYNFVYFECHSPAVAEI